MSPDEFRALAAPLFGGGHGWQAAMARAVGVADRTVRRWAAEGLDPEAKGSRLVQAFLITSWAGRVLAGINAQAAEMIKAGRKPPAEVTLTVYPSDAALRGMTGEAWSAETHRAIMTQASAAMIDRGLSCRLVQMDPAAYAAWLDGRQNTSAERAAWAALQS